MTVSNLTAVLLGLIIGITTALRQYSGYDYGVTFLSFLFFSLPIFWVAVLLKQFLAIGFNDFLESPTYRVVGRSRSSRCVSGLIWMSIIPRKGIQRVITFGIAAAATAAVLVYMAADRLVLDARTSASSASRSPRSAPRSSSRRSRPGSRSDERCTPRSSWSRSGWRAYFPFMNLLSFYLNIWTWLGSRLC